MRGAAAVAVQAAESALARGSGGAGGARPAPGAVPALRGSAPARRRAGRRGRGSSGLDGAATVRQRCRARLQLTPLRNPAERTGTAGFETGPARCALRALPMWRVSQGDQQ
jgi:hypothetical protein